MPKIFISGIPGMGKTFMGNYFRDVFQFEHIDLESGEFRMNNEEEIRHSTAELLKKNGKVVITWGFPCHDPYFSFLNTLRAGGFIIVWLDGNRVAAHKAFMKRGQNNINLDINLYEYAFITQIQSIDSSNAVNRLQPDLNLNTFTKKGAHLPPSKIAQFILDAVGYR
jgi:hypothetical protein